MTDKIIKTGIVVAGIVAIVFMAYSVFVNTHIAFASAPSGLQASQYTATTTVVGASNNTTLFSAGQCASRVIRTQAKDIYLLFADMTNGDLASTTLTGVVGFTQAASTTVAYDSGIYGCGRMIGTAPASTTITIAQFN